MVRRAMTNLTHRWFAAHPQSVGESYAEHFAVALRFGLTMLMGGVACVIHAVCPMLFERTGSGAVKRLYSEMVSRQSGHARPAYDEPYWRPEYEI